MSKNNSLSLGSIGDAGLETQVTASAFTFSATAVDQLSGGSSSYTLATVVVDVSGSVGGYEKVIEATLSAIVDACQKDPMADQLLFRVVTFNTSLTEVHGFKPLGSINAKDYNGTIRTGGGTSLFDALLASIEAGETYGQSLAQQAFMANAVTFVITDGEDNGSTFGASDVKKAVARVVAAEHLESSNVILLGLSADPNLNTYLNSVKNGCGINQSMLIGTFSGGDPSTQVGHIAKLAGFVSHSVSSTAQALGTGGPSKSIAAALTITP